MVVPAESASRGRRSLYREPKQGMARNCGAMLMTNMRFMASATYDSSDPIAFRQEAVLERAVAKVVLLGELVGVSTDQMIRLLNSGLTVGELLEYLATRAGNAV